jgi:hypothetical protein
LSHKAFESGNINTVNRLNRTRTIGVKVSENCFAELRAVAEAQGKPLCEWCRDKIMEAAQPLRPAPSDYALMAELTATQAILIDLLCVLGRDSRISTEKAQEIVDAAHNSKY